MAEFNKLLEAEIPRLRRYARVLCRGNPARGDDLVQDTLMRALSKQHLWQPGTNLLGWLFTIMHNLNVNEVRRSVKSGEVVGDEV
ncbi:MAG: RNA polymerase sigma factor, partial [Alphaproteobacteria bacterium]|nr:RNA polymerase sigma factor [Alphaproteobacteria bacterium]